MVYRGEHCIRNAWVGGSNPSVGTNSINKNNNLQSNSSCDHRILPTDKSLTNFDLSDYAVEGIKGRRM